MNAVSPYSLLDQTRPGHSVVGTSATGQRIPAAAERHNAQSGGIVGAFSDAWSKLDINDDGKLNGADAAGHILTVGARLIGGVLGIELAGNPGAGSDPAQPLRPAAEAAFFGAPARADAANTRASASPRALVAQDGLPLARALAAHDGANPTRLEAIRATYSALRAERGYGGGLA